MEVEPEALTGVYKNMERGIVALVLRCAAISDDLRTSDEAVDVRWLTAKEIREEMDEAYAVRLLDALEEDPPAIRSHDGESLTSPTT